MDEEQDQPRDIRSSLYTCLGTMCAKVRPSSQPLPPGVQPFPGDQVFMMELLSSNGTTETLPFTIVEWKRLLSNMIKALSDSGDPMGEELYKWCEENLGRRGEEPGESSGG